MAALSLRESLIEYRVPMTAALLVFSLASMFVLTSQSASSFATYLLAAYVIYGLKHWSALFEDWTFLASAALLAYLAASSLWSEPWGARAVLSQSIRSLLVFTFIVAVAECFRVDWFRERLTVVFGFFGAVAALVALVMFAVEPPLDGRLAGLGQLDTHVEAAMVFAVALICLLASVRDAGRARWLHYVSAGVLGVAVVLSGSRNAIASLLIGCLTLFAQRIETPRRFVLVLSVTIGALVVAVAAAALVSPAVAASCCRAVTASASKSGRC